VTTIDQAIVEEAAILTGIGIGTAFGLLVMLMVVIFIVRLSSGYLLERAAMRAAREEAESRNRAHAAVAAVTAIVAARARADTAGGDQG
jgi:Na+-transporting methylmalonyl-CoA/oxaloacetate decarboxylase gamma subunit